jgi:hypothetical protein
MTNVRPLREHYGPNEDLAFQRDLNTWHYSEVEYLRGVIRDVSNSPHIPPVERRILKEALTDSDAHEPEVGETFPPETLRLAKEASERVAGPIPGNPLNDWKLGEEPPSQGYCGNWPCRLPKYHTGPCNSSPSQRT